LKRKNGECTACLKYPVLTFVKKVYKMQHLEGRGTPVLYAGSTVLKGWTIRRPASLLARFICHPCPMLCLLEVKTYFRKQNLPICVSN